MRLAQNNFMVSRSGKSIFLCGSMILMLTTLSLSTTAQVLGPESEKNKIAVSSVTEEEEIDLPEKTDKEIIISPDDPAFIGPKEQKEKELSIKEKFIHYFKATGQFLFDVMRGPQTGKLLELPKAFKKSNYVVKKYIHGKTMLYVEATPGAKLPKEKDVFFAYILSDQLACEVNVVSVVDRWILVDNKNCQRFSLIYIGDYLVPKTDKNKNFWPRRYSNDYLAFWIQHGEKTIDIAGDSFGGTVFNYGVRAALDLSTISRVQVNYGIGKNDLSGANKSNIGAFQGVSLSSFHVLGRWSHTWQYNFKDFTLVPMAGMGTFFENLNGHPTTEAAGGGITVGAFIKSNRYKTVLDTTFSYCLIGCHLSEVGPSVVAAYSAPEILEFRINAKSDILPMTGWGMLTFFEYYSVKSSSAYISSDTAQPRNFNNEFWGLGLGLTYSWN